MHASSHKTSVSKVARTLQEVHLDVAGPHSVLGRSKEQYYLTLVDVFSNLVWAICFKTRDQVPVLVHQGLLHLQSLAKAKVAVIRSDNATEFHSKELSDLLLPMQVVQNFSAPYIHQMAGHAERMIQRLDHLVRAMLVDAGLHVHFWPDAVLAAAHIHNRLQSRGSTLTPWEILTGIRPDVSHIKVWGCKVFVHLPSELQTGHFQPRAQEGILLGYSDHNDKCWLVLIDGGVYDRGDVTFLEGDSRQHLYAGHLPGVHAPIPTPLPALPQLPPPALALPQPPAAPPPPPAGRPALPPGGRPKPLSAGRPAKPAPTPIYNSFVPPISSWQDRVTRSAAGKPPAAVLALLAVIDSMTVGVEEPLTIKAALAGPEASQWIAACLEELAGLEHMNTWTLVDRPTHCNVLPVKWVFKVKRDMDGFLERFKARICAKGFKQRHGIDYQEVFAPVASAATFRALMAAVAMNGWHVRQIDFKQAFLNGELQEEVYINQPPGFDDGSTKVLKLHKSLYGLKQAPRAWHDTLKKALALQGFTQSTADPALFLRPGSWLLLWVDDQLMIGPDLDLLQSIIVLLNAQFELTDMGAAQFYVNVAISISPGRVALSQQRYITDLIRRFPLPPQISSRPATVPGIVRRKDLSMALKQPFPLYASLIGALLYLAVWTRPDISNSTQKLTRSLATPTQEDLVAAYRILNYLSHTQDLAIVYTADASPAVEAFCDSDYASDPNSVPPRRSTSGAVVLMAGGPILWASKTQASVAASTCEAEYMASNVAAKDGLWLRHLLPELGIPNMGPFLIQCDNEACISLIKNPQCTSKAKHIDIIHHFVRERVSSNELAFEFVAGADNVADLFTKPLELGVFLRHRARLLQPL
jgi:histone deacetylase 1/2